MSDYETQARAAKVAALCDEIRRHPDLTIETVETAGPAFWSALAVLAGVHDPSETTRLMVIDQIRRNQTRVDPFAGLP